MGEPKPYGPIFWIHLLVNFIFVMSFLLFSWEIILVGVVLLEVQFILFNGCVLSKAEFGRDEPCIPYYLKRWGLVKNKGITKVFVRYVLPAVVLFASIVLQEFFEFKPLIF